MGKKEHWATPGRGFWHLLDTLAAVRANDERGWGTLSEYVHLGSGLRGLAVSQQFQRMDRPDTSTSIDAQRRTH